MMNHPNPDPSRAPGGTPSPHACRTGWVIAALLAVMVLLMVFVDPTVGRWSLTASQLPWVHQFRAYVTPLGRDAIHGFFAVGLLLAALVFRSGIYARMALVVVVTYVLAGSSCHMIKMITHRPRPETIPAPWLGGWGVAACMLEDDTHSFPSGDVTIAAALATIWFLALGRGRARYAVYVVPLLSAVGRVLGAAHYPSDTLAGGLWGTLWAVWVWRWIMPRARPSPPDDTSAQV